MFRSFVYVNTDNFYEYYSLVDPSIMEQLKSKQNKVKAEGSIGFKGSALTIGRESNSEVTISSSFLYDYNGFEDKLEILSEVNFFNLDEGDYDLSTIPSMSLIKMRTNMYIPEEFDFIDLVNQFKPMLMAQLDYSGNEQVAVETMLENTKADIPIIIEFDDYAICGKLDTRFLNDDYTTLEDYESDEVTILCKVLSRNLKPVVEIFNPFKDFIKLNRQMRRTMKSTPGEEFSPISVDGPVMKVEIIAIYR